MTKDISIAIRSFYKQISWLLQENRLAEIRFKKNIFFWYSNGLRGRKTIESFV